GLMPATRVFGLADRTQYLRAFGELGEIGLTLFVECIASFLSFLCHVKEHRCVAGELLDARLPIAVGVEPRLQAAERNRRVLEHLPAPLDRCLFELFIRDDAVDKAHLERFFCIVLAAEKPDLPRFFLPYDPGEVARAIPAVERTDFGTCLAKNCVIGCNCQVAEDMEHMAA